MVEVEQHVYMLCMYVCVITVRIFPVITHSRMHKDIDTSDNRDRLNSDRHVLVQAAVTTQLCHHTWKHMYSVKAPAGEEYRTCLKQLKTAKTCEERDHALITTRAQQIKADPFF